jgi:hypothetical protein
MAQRLLGSRRNLPAAAGDFYDFLVIDERRLTIVCRQRVAYAPGWLVSGCGMARDPAASILADRPRRAVRPSPSFSPSWTSAVPDAKTAQKGHGVKADE